MSVKKPDVDRPYDKIPGHPCEAEPDTVRVLDYVVRGKDLLGRVVESVVGDFGVIVVCVDANDRVLSSLLVPG
jgi:hypothetical protein